MVYERYSFDPRIVTDDWIDTVHEVMSLDKHKEAVRMMVQENAAGRYFFPELAAQKRETLAWLRKEGCRGQHKSYLVKTIERPR